MEGSGYDNLIYYILWNTTHPLIFVTQAHSLSPNEIKCTQKVKYIYFVKKKKETCKHTAAKIIILKFTLCIKTLKTQQRSIDVGNIKIKYPPTPPSGLLTTTDWSTWF